MRSRDGLSARATVQTTTATISAPPAAATGDDDTQRSAGCAVAVRAAISWPRGASARATGGATETSPSAATPSDGEPKP